jgi:hypothetical protein
VENGPEWPRELVERWLHAPAPRFTDEALCPVGTGIADRYILCAQALHMNRRGTEPYARWCGRTAGAIPPPSQSGTCLKGFIEFPVSRMGRPSPATGPGQDLAALSGANAFGAVCEHCSNPDFSRSEKWLSCAAAERVGGAAALSRARCRRRPAGKP